MKSRLWLLLLLTIVLLWASPAQELMDKLQKAPGAEQQTALFRQYLPQVRALEDHRKLQALWARSDQQAMQEYYDELAGKHPQNPDYQYLRLRYLESAEQISGARQLIVNHPEFYWGYRLLAICLSEEILAAKPQSVADLPSKSDIHLLQNGFARYPDDDDLAMALFLLHLESNDLASARESLRQVQDPLALTANWQRIHAFTLAIKDIELYSAKLPHLIGVYIEQGIIAKEDSLAVYNDQLGNFRDQLSTQSQEQK